MAILLSCVSTNHALLKRHWAKSREEIACPVTVLGSYQKPEEDQEGLVCLIDEAGQVQKTVAFPTPAGMVYSDSDVLIATLFAIHEVSPDLSAVRRDVVSLPIFNTLHSLSRTRRGYLAASTGLDAIVEFTKEGQLLWSWWATDHGFEFTPAGVRREVDRATDHRGTRFGTLVQTTHVNSAAELPDGRILASLFHQGTVIVIERDSGAWRVVLDGLDHPHAVRVLDEQHFTVADTGRGRALMVSVDSQGQGKIEREISVETNWLQDCQYDLPRDRWLLVDGQQSRVLLRSGPGGEKDLARYELDPQWRLYEALVI